MMRTGSLVFALILLSGCVADPPVADGAEVQVIASQTRCGLTAPGLVLARNAAEWQALIGSVDGQLPDWPDVANQWLLVASLGHQATGGHGIGFISADRDGQDLSIEVKVTHPAPDAMVAQMITSPCLVMAIPASGWKQVRVNGEAPFPMTRPHP
ncbi:protease complex subunit PrcB family protein [Marinobacter halodurans]|uniref:Protease complex subunit PrcB family protein n=1 Tax=Marinobacter halodurans TaxID=2528979 RepID=A0ABY1ZLY1_9GAMM|nr:protease complex subunit PrcB family protein [Marinobacter halodurans]TBW56886.1 protease complex subunit PrcB family protein [Marinobacter halodurans]